MYLELRNESTSTALKTETLYFSRVLAPTQPEVPRHTVLPRGLRPQPRSPSSRKREARAWAKITKRSRGGGLFIRLSVHCKDTSLKSQQLSKILQPIHNLWPEIRSGSASLQEAAIQELIHYADLQ